MMLLDEPRIQSKTFGQTSVSYGAPHELNEFHLDIKTSLSIYIFKNSLKTYLFGLAFLPSYLFVSIAFFIL